jgi:hypothetical protein
MQVWALFWHIRTLTNQPIALGGIGLARIIPGMNRCGQALRRDKLV